MIQMALFFMGYMQAGLLLLLFAFFCCLVL